MSVDKFLEVRNLKKYFPAGRGKICRAVDDVSFTIKKGKTLGIVGESGCGKTTLVKTVMNIHHPTEGRIFIDSEPHHISNRKDAMAFTSKIQMIFQDPYSSLNPRMTVGDIIAEGWDIRREYQRVERKQQILELLDKVGLNEEHINRFPHEFSGGQRQRIGIARALSMQPQILICDEPVSALDVSVQAQIMNLLIELQISRDLTYLFIAHDLSMVRHISECVAVMYLGKIMEYAPTSELYRNPLHPYSRVLFSAVPIPDPKLERERKQIDLKGDIPSPMEVGSGCKFAGRCPQTKDICFQLQPEMKKKDKVHYVACHFV